MTAAATYTKLRSGEWGVRVIGGARQGQTLTVQKKSGETKRETVGRVLWTGSDSRTGQIMSLCTIGRGSASSPRLRRDGTYECDECGDYVKPGTRCWETGHAH